MKYDVNLGVKAIISVCVEADNAQQAMKLAEEKCKNPFKTSLEYCDGGVKAIGVTEYNAWGEFTLND